MHRRDQVLGAWSIDHFDQPEWDVSSPSRPIPPGRWTRLRRADSTDPWMTDTPGEVLDHWPFLKVAAGAVLMNGLGLGMALEWMLRHRPEVDHVDVVEADEEVIALVGPYFDEWVDAGRLSVRHGDAYRVRWPAGTRWDYAWHDIWVDLRAENVGDMDRLEARYASRVGWQRSWGRRECEAMAMDRCWRKSA